MENGKEVNPKEKEDFILMMGCITKEMLRKGRQPVMIAC